MINKKNIYYKLLILFLSLFMITSSIATLSAIETSDKKIAKIDSMKVVETTLSKEKDEQGMRNATITVFGCLKDDKSNPLANKQIISFDTFNDKFDETVTNKKGHFTLDYTINYKSSGYSDYRYYDSFKHLFYAYFNGNDEYLNCFNKIEVDNIYYKK